MTMTSGMRTMNLISCEGCGVVLDASHLTWPQPEDFWYEVGQLDSTMFQWDSDKFRHVGLVKCPVCGHRIPDPN